MAEAELTNKATVPSGVLRKNMKAIVFLGACVVVIVAGLFSANSKKPSAQASAKSQGPQPMLQDNTESNVADLKNTVAAGQQRQAQAGAGYPTDPSMANTTPAQQFAAA